MAWLLTPLGVFALLGMALARQDAVATATMVQDRLLLGSARIIAQQISYEDGMLEVAIPPAALELFQSRDQDRVYYRIASPRGQLLSGYAELPPPPGSLRAEEHHLFTSVVRGQPVRVVAYAQPVFAAPEEGPVVIEVAQTLEAHGALVRQIWTTNLRQGFWMLALATALVWVALRYGLKSLTLLQDKVRQRDPGSLEPLDPGPAPRELQPLVGAINDYVKRLDTQMALRSRFIANAAHQLRTPFTVLQTQVNFGLRSDEPGPKDDALKAILQGVRQGTRLVNQLLSLSTVEAAQPLALPAESVDLADMAQRVLEEHAAMAQAKELDLGLDRQTPLTAMVASPSLLHELLANLVDNAIRYTPAKGVVTVGLAREGATLLLRVEDNGPGIAPEDRTRVFERFCRLHQDDTPGCGLGLAIAQEVVVAMGGEIRLSAPAQGTGLVVAVTLPVLKGAGTG